MEKKLPPDIIPLYEYTEHEGKSEMCVVVGWREVPRGIMYFYFDETHDMLVNFYVKDAFDVTDFKKL